MKRTPLTSAQLLGSLARAHAGEPDACRLLLKCVYESAVGVLGSQHPDVDDVAQVAFLRIQSKWTTYDSSRGHSAQRWLDTVVIRIVFDRYRARRRKGEVTTSPFDVDQQTHMFGTVEHDATTTVAITMATSRLPPEQRAIIILKYWHGMSDREIGLELGLPEGTVKTKRWAAYDSIREALGPMMREGTSADEAQNPLKGGRT